jgi:hypothetical protein
VISGILLLHNRLWLGFFEREESSFFEKKEAKKLYSGTGFHARLVRQKGLGNGREGSVHCLPHRLR